MAQPNLAVGPVQQNVIEFGINYFIPAPKPLTLSISFKKLNYEEERKRFNDYETMRKAYEAQLRNSLNDSTLTVALIQSGSVKVTMDTYQPPFLLYQLSKSQLKLPAPRQATLIPVSTSIFWNGGEMFFSEPDQLEGFAKHLTAHLTALHPQLALGGIGQQALALPAQPANPSPTHLENLQAICDSVRSHAKTMRPSTVHTTELEEGIVMEIRWDRTTQHQDWLHIIVEPTEIQIIYDTPGKDESVPLGHPQLEHKIGVATSSLAA